MGRIFGNNLETGAAASPINVGTNAIKQLAATQPKSPLGGLWHDIPGAVSNVFNSGWNSFKTGWSWFVDHESRPARAIETTLDKMVGGQKGTQTSWTDIFKGATFQKSLDITGEDLVNDTVKKAAQLMGQEVPDQTKWQYKVPAFIGGLAADVILDPFMYVGLGEGAKAGAVLAQDGSKLGFLTDAGVQFLKDDLKVNDLTKVSQEGMATSKAKLANAYLGGAKDLLSSPKGLTFMGKEVLSSGQMDQLVGRMKANKTYQFLAESSPVQSVKNFTNTIFNPRWVGGGVNRELPEDYYKAYQQLFRDNTLSKQEAITRGLKIFGPETDPKVTEEIFRLANGEGALAADGSGKLLQRADLAGKTFQEARSMVDPSVSDQALKGYMNYINDHLPAIESRKAALGMNFEGLNDHIKNYYPELAKYTEARGMLQRPLKILKAGFEKGRVTDEEMAKAFWDATGKSGPEIDAIMSGSTPEAVKKAADSYRSILGLSRDPYLAVAKDYSELSIKENTTKFINDTLQKYGKKISPDEVKQYQQMGWGIYYPKGNLRFYPLEEGGAGVAKGTAYAFENPAVANSLNAFSTDVKQNAIHRALNKLSSSIVNLYFYNPATVLYHSLHNVAYNSWLADGVDAFDNVTKGVEDVTKKTSMYERAVKSGALRPEGSLGGTLKEAVDTTLNRTPSEGNLKNILGHLNPLGRNHYMNQVFNGADNALRMNLFRNSIQMGSSDTEAADFVNHFAGNYANMSEVEKSTFRTMYPYYSWFKTNVKANFGSWLTDPARQLIPVKTWNALNEALSGRHIWQNGPGNDFKIATGQKDPKTGREIFVNPSIAGNIVPQMIEDPTGLIMERMLSGPIENIASSLTLGKDTYEALNGINTPESMPGAPASAKVAKALTQIMPFDNARGLLSNQNFMNVVLAWDTAHPLWRNILDAIVQSYTSTPLPPNQLKNMQRSDLLKYNKAVRRRELKSK